MVDKETRGSKRWEFYVSTKLGSVEFKNQTVAGRIEYLPTKSLFATVGRSGKSLVLPGVSPPGQCTS